MNLYQDVFFRALDMVRGRRTIERLRFLRQSQSWDPERLRAWQLQRLNALLQQARDGSVYYRERLQGVRLPLTSLDALAGLPVLTKQAIRENFEGLQCRNLPRSRFVLSRTGGSTGEPTFYFWDKRGQDWNRASVYRSAEWAGVALGERTAQMSGSHFDFTQAQRLSSRIVFLLQRYRDFPVAVLDHDRLERYFLDLRSWRPTSIWGYASGVTALAAHVEAHHPGADLGFVRAVVTSSETLRPEQRLQIERVFGPGRVHDHYGSREMYLAAECSAHRGYHVQAEVLVLEVVGPDNRPCPPGERGRVLVTDLSNHAFPFVRYEIGDIGVRAEDDPCPCGVTLPRLAAVEGRIADMVVLRDRVLTPPNFTILFSDIRGIKSYQVRQEAIDQLDVYIVPDTDYKDEVAVYVRGAIEQMVEGKARVVIHQVDEIAVPESGKRRFIVSTVGGGRL
jgi:phenylacetate-CoA ligase